MLRGLREMARRVRAMSGKFSYRPLVEVTVSRGALVHNVEEFLRRSPGLHIVPVLKSNAYGHGLAEVAEVLESIRRARRDIAARVPFFVVDTYYEALALRRGGVRTPLVVLGYSLVENIIGRRRAGLRDVAFTLTSLDQVREVVASVRVRRAFHLKIDTGMRRQGVLLEEVDEALQLIASNPLVVLEGVCSHFADADGADEATTRAQIAVWNEVVMKVRAAGKVTQAVQFFHLSATAGQGRAFSDHIDANVARLGIGLYGIEERGAASAGGALRPALRMESVVSLVKLVRRGEGVGYGLTYRASRDTQVAVVPVGYFEGVDRRLSNQGALLVRGVVCPIVGRVSMNMTTIDVSAVDGGVRRGDRVVVISDDAASPNSLVRFSQICGTIPYELLVHVNQGLRRKVVD